MVVVNFLIQGLVLIFKRRELFSKFHVHTLRSNQVWLSVIIESLMNQVCQCCFTMALHYTCGQKHLQWLFFFINRLPSISLESNTLYFKLQGNHPNYSFLRVFGSKCFPYTWDTRKNKFDPKNCSMCFHQLQLST